MLIADPNGFGSFGVHCPLWFGRQKTCCYSIPIATGAIATWSHQVMCQFGLQRSRQSPSLVRVLQKLHARVFGKMITCPTPTCQTCWIGVLSVSSSQGPVRIRQRMRSISLKQRFPPYPPRETPPHLTNLASRIGRLAFHLLFHTPHLGVTSDQHRTPSPSPLSAPERPGHPWPWHTSWHCDLGKNSVRLDAKRSRPVCCGASFLKTRNSSQKLIPKRQ